MNRWIARPAAAAVLSFAVAGSASAAVVTLNQTIDVNSLSHPNPSQYSFDASDFAPFSLNLSEGDILVWTISFQPGQSLTIPNISSIFPVLHPTIYTGDIDTGDFAGAAGRNRGVITFFEGSGNEVGWDPADGALSNDLVGLFQPYLYGNLEPSITFSSIEVRLQVLDYRDPGVTTVNFSTATLNATQPALLPGQSPEPPQRTLPSSKPQFLFPSSTDLPPVSAVPEPATWTMLILGFGGVGFAMRRRKILSLAKETQ